MNLGRILAFVLSHPLNRGQRISAVGRFLRWQFASRLLPYPVALPFVDAMDLVARRGMTGATGNFYCGLHEAEDMAFVLHFLRPGDLFYDIGANVGSYSLLAAAAGVKRVLGFEPSSETAARYAQNVRWNALQDVVEIHQVALGAIAGELRFTQGEDTTNHVLADGEQFAAIEVVSVRRFDEFFVPGMPSFIKMDVEGFESAVLAGATNALKDPALLGMLIEDNGSHHRYSGASSVSAIARENGFDVFRYDPQQRRLATVSGPPGNGNLLFLRDREAAAERVRSARRFRLVNGWI